MQGRPYWSGTPSSALSSESSPNQHNYFYNYPNQWNRPASSYDSAFYGNQHQKSNYSANTMRYCGETAAVTSQNNGYHCPPPIPQTYYRHPTSDYSENGGHSRPRQDRMANSNGYTNEALTTHRPLKPTILNSASTSKSNDPGDSENFSSVFTQSLTSLYSQDADGNFVEEKPTFKCEPDPEEPCAPQKMDEQTSALPPTSAAPPSQLPSNEYSFSSVFGSTGGVMVSPTNSFEPIKIKSEPYSGDDYPFEHFSQDDLFLRKNRGSLADAYTRKRKHSVPAMSFNRSSISEKNPKESNLYPTHHHHSQWIPNSVQCINGDTSAESSYHPQQNYQTKQFANSQPMHFNRTSRNRGEESLGKKPAASLTPPLSFRLSGNKNELMESKPTTSLSSKKHMKKVSPLTIYAKIMDDRILEVTCRRFKKRTKSTGIEPTTMDGFQRPPNFRYLYQNENVREIVGNVMSFIVDRVARTSYAPSQNNLSNISPVQTKDLFLKLCRDYSLDIRDFQSIDDILRPKVMSAKDHPEESFEKKRKRAKVTEVVQEPEVIKETLPDSKSSNTECPPVAERKRTRGCTKQPKEAAVAKDKSTERPSNRAEDSKPKLGRGKTSKKKSPSEDIPVRILRSLPSRQPVSTATKRTRRSSRNNNTNPVKDRYPRRNLRSRNLNMKSGRRLKIVIDLSKENDEKGEVLEIDSSDASRPPHMSDDEKKVDHTDSAQSECVNSKHEDDVKPPGDATATSVIVVDSQDDVSVLPRILCTEGHGEENSNKERTETSDDDIELRKPPQLVCMGSSNDNLFLEDSTEKEMPAELKKELSEQESTENSMVAERPSTEEPANDDTSESLKIGSKFSHSLSQDSDEEKLVIDMDSCDENKGVPMNLSTSGDIETKGDNDVTMKDITQGDEDDVSGDDDCIIVHSECDSSKKKHSNLPEIHPAKPFDFLSTSTILNEKSLPEVPHLQKMDTTAGAFKPTFLTKDEQDESILRTLLLESEAASNPALLKELESSGGCSPVMASVMGLTKQEGLPSLGLESIKSLDLDTLTSTILPQFHSDANLSPRESLIIPKFQSYQDTSDKSLSPNTYEDAQKNFKSSESSSSSSMNHESAETIIKDPQQLKEKIKTLKNEIFYLQVMAEQKEKEKVAIVCFKRYKEEILKRICKAYAFSVQDHVRDWIFMKRENTAENRSGATLDMQGTSQKNEGGNVPCTSEQEKPADQNQRDVRQYHPSLLPTNPSNTLLHHQQQHRGLSSSKQAARRKTSEKVSAVETMVAKATENYGLDMTNLRERLRHSPETPGTILQKMLSNKTSSLSSHNSTPDQFSAGSWSPSENLQRPGSIQKSLPPILPKPYPETYVPLDVIPPQRNSGESPKNLERFRNSPSDVVKPQILSDGKSNRSPFRSWSIQTGARIDKRVQSNFVKISPNMTQSNGVHHQRQPNHANVKSIPSRQQGSTTAFSSYNSNTNCGLMSDHRSLRNKPESAHCKKPSMEDRHALNYSNNGPAISSNSTMPYGGHIIQHSASVTPTINPKPTSSSSTSPSTPLCMGCGVSDAKYLCSGCRKHWYCSPQCQSLRWPEHSRVCGSRQTFPQTSGTYCQPPNNAGKNI